MSGSTLRLCRLFFLCGLPVTLLAQFNASLQGTITDLSGGLVPGARVQLKNDGTGTTAETTSNDQGFYRFNQIPAGAYDLSVTAPGFQTGSVTNIQVAADLPQNSNVTLSPGTVQSTTTVVASALPTLQTSDGSISGTISSAAVEDLPTFGRDPYELIRTMPGIIGTGGRSGTGTAVALGNSTGPGGSSVSIFQTENQVQVSSSGQRVEQNVFLIDGVNVNSLGWGGAAVVTPNSESVQDMTVIATDYSAEAGRDSGAQIRTTTKSGTDQFHGSGVFLYQDPNLNAYNKWGGPSGALPVRVENNYRQYAASLGGPIVKNKLFFFLSYEGLHNKTTTYGQEWTTTPQYRQLIQQTRANTTIGQIFSSVNNTPRVLQVLSNASTTCAAVFGANAASSCRNVAGGLDVGSPGPGITPGDPYYPIYPNAGSIGAGFDGIPDIQDVQYYLPSEQIGNQFNARFDYNLTSKDLLFGSAYVTHLNQISADSTSAGAPDADVAFKPLNTAVTAANVRNISPTMINELRGNFTRFADNGLTDNTGINWGIPRVQVEAYPFGNMQIAGAPQGGDTPAILAQNTYEARDTLIKVWGNHTVRFGGQFRWEQDNDNLLGGARPLYSFSGLWNVANNAPIFESIFANASTGGAPNAARYFRDHGDAVFVQDDWHVLPTLTLNLGVRWEYFSPLTEKQSQLYNIFLGATGSAPLVDAQVRHVSQLWDPTGKTSCRNLALPFRPSRSSWCAAVLV